MKDKLYVVNEQYEDDCGRIESVNHVFLDLEKAKAMFEELCDPYQCENVVLQVGAEDPNTGEIVGVGEAILHWNADEAYEKEVADEYCNTDASYFVTTGDPWDV